MDFATLPPEINSGRMYSGPGAGSMMEAATAWDRLAARLCTAAADYRAVTAKLAAGCAGPASAAMTEAAARYINWLDTVAARSEHAATQLAAAAGAHRSALAAMVPPPVITTNRAQRRSLARENCLGQTSPAIADLDAEYEQMWVQDADAMNAYADASADAATVTPFTSPPGDQGGAAGTWALRSAPDVVSAGSQVMSTIPAALQALSRSPLISFDASLSSVTPPLSRLSSLSAPSDSAIKHLNSLNKEAALWTLFTKPARAGRAAPTRGFGRGTAIGKLSVPKAWATATAPIAVYRGTVA
jgi:PPE-repeat protein